MCQNISSPGPPCTPGRRLAVKVRVRLSSYNTALLEGPARRELSNNSLERVFPEFAEKIAAKTKGGVAELAQCDFSTTTPVERVVSQITLMDTVQHYFQYTMCCGCGFPSITLTGTPADWERVRSKAAALRSYDLDWWLDALLPALDHFVQAAHGPTAS